MNRKALLKELESMTHDERTARLIELGRRVSRNGAQASQESKRTRERLGDVIETLDALERGGFYERRLALISCFSSRDGERVLRFFDDASLMLRGLALRLAALACDDAQVQAALEAASLKTRRSLLKRLLKQRRHGAINSFLEGLAARGDENLDRLLAYGSARFVAARVDAVLEQAGAADWTRLARFHPNLAADALERRAHSATALDKRLVSRANAALSHIADHDAGRALSLIEVLGRNTPLSQLFLQRLAKRAPAAVVDLMRAGEDVGAVSFHSVFTKLDAERILWLLEHRPQSLNVTPRWRRLPRELRAAIYENARLGWRNADGIIDRELLAHLAREPREAEGRRHLALPALATRPAQRLPYAALLPWPEARETLDPFIRNPDPDLRTLALASLIFAARYHRDRVPELLEMVSARRNEQDPIRGAMLAGLCALPPGVWRNEHLEMLGSIIRQALDAADLSVTTANAAERLVVALLPRHPAWSVQWLATLVRERGQVTVYDLGDRLCDADVRRMAPFLLPVLQSWQTREREAQIISVARGLGKRLAVWDELAALLESVIRKTLTAWNADSALTLLAQHCPPRLRVLVPALVRADPSWVTRPAVYTFLHRRRQDLLSPLLGQTAFKGRFSTGRTRWVLPFSSGFARWTPSQQATFAQTLNSVTQDAERDSPALLRVITQLAALPDIEPKRLMNLADARNPKIAVRDAALRALGSLDAGQGMTFLIEAMDDDRARIAIYALRRSLLDMPQSRALSLLRAMPLARVTVAKEVVRLLGELASGEAYGELLRMNDFDLHRDVRVALLRALWDHLERDETWAILEGAANSPDAAIATMAGRTPADRLSAKAQKRLAALVAGLLSHPDAQVRGDVLIRCAQLPIDDRDEVLLEPLLARLDSILPDECAWASAAVFATYAGRRETLIARAVSRVLPNRRALQTLVQQLKSELSFARRNLLPTARAVLSSLNADPITVALQVELAIAALPSSEIVALLEKLAASNELHADALAVGGAALRDTRRFDRADLEAMEQALFASPNEFLRRLALAALLAQSASPRGWDENRSARLNGYRADASTLVAAAAQFTFVAQA